MSSLKKMVNSDLYFTVFYLVAVLLSIPPHTFMAYKCMLVISIMWGIIRLADIFLVKREVYFHKDFLLLFLFVSAYALAIVINYKQSFFNNVGQMISTCIYLFVIYINNTNRSQKETVQTIKVLSWCIMVFNFFIALISLLMYILKISYDTVRNGTEVRVGLNIRGANKVQLFGITVSSSVLSCTMAATVIIIIILFFIYKGTSKKITVLLWTDMAITLFVFCAADAFSGLIMLMAAGCCYCFVELIRNKRFKIANIICKSLVTILSCALVVALSFGLYSLGQKTANVVFKTTTQLSQNLNNKDITTPKDETSQDANKTDETSQDANKISVLEIPEERLEKLEVGREVKSSTTGTRMLIWREAIKLFIKNPLGVTNSNTKVEILIDGSTYEYSNLHNGYITILVSTGIFGFVFIAIFGIRYLLSQFKYLMTAKESQSTRLSKLLLCFIAAVLAGDLVNGCFVLWRGFYYLMFWVFLAAIESLREDRNTNETISTRNLNEV